MFWEKDPTSFRNENVPAWGLLARNWGGFPLRPMDKEQRANIHDHTSRRIHKGSERNYVNIAHVKRTAAGPLPHMYDRTP